MKRAKKPTPQKRPPAEQLEIVPGIDIQTFPLFSGSAPRVYDSPFTPKPASRKPSVNMFGEDTRPTLEQLQQAHKGHL